MRVKRSIQISSAILSVLVLCMLFSATVQAAVRPVRVGLTGLAQEVGTPTSINASVYLTGNMLRPMFQSNINQSIPQMVSNALSSMVGQLPAQDRGWALQMANALLQPSATLVSVQPEAGGLLTTLKISLYPGDPKALTTSVLIGLKVINASTIQVTALPPAGGGQGLVSGPLTTFTVPIGSLNSIAATPRCGDANLNVNLKFPVALGQAHPTSAVIPAGHSSARGLTTTLPSDHATNSYIELPAASLAQLGGSIGTLQVSSSITARNIRVGLQGSNLAVTTDISWHGLNVGTAVSTMVPGALNGNLVVNVQKTSLQILGGLFSFPINSYNQQVQQTLNAQLNGALSGVFYVNQASIGTNPHLTCAAADSLVMAGAITLS